MGWDTYLGRESTPQSGLEALRLLKGALPGWICVVSETALCVCVHSKHACNAARPIKSHAQPGYVGLRVPQMALANSSPGQTRKPQHPDALASPWHQPTVSSKHVAETESPKIPCLTRCAGVFLFSRTLLTPPPGPLIQSPP